MIRPATAQDIPRIVEMGRKHHALMNSRVPYDDDSAADLVARFIASPDALVLVSEDGSIGGALSPHMFNRRAVIATEIWWHAFDAAGVALLEGFEAWAKARGAVEAHLSALEAYRPAAVARSLRSRGYEPFQRSLMKEFV